MNRYDNDDDLERALFALPLEEPPATLRREILDATIHAPAPAITLPHLGTLETGLYGALVALLVWLCVAVTRGDAANLDATLLGFGSHVIAFFSAPMTLLWLCAGTAIAAALSNETLIGARGVLPNFRR